jgi:hypothetical protein
MQLDNRKLVLRQEIRFSGGKAQLDSGYSNGGVILGSNGVIIGSGK